MSLQHQLLILPVCALIFDPRISHFVRRGIEATYQRSSRQDTSPHEQNTSETVSMVTCLVAHADIHHFASCRPNLLILGAIRVYVINCACFIVYVIMEKVLSSWSKSFLIPVLVAQTCCKRISSELAVRRHRDRCRTLPTRALSWHACSKNMRGPELFSRGYTTFVRCIGSWRVYRATAPIYEQRMKEKCHDLPHSFISSV